MIQLKLFPEGVQEKDVWAVYDKQFEKLGHNVSSREAWVYWIENHMDRAKRIELDTNYYMHVIWKTGRDFG